MTISVFGFSTEPSAGGDWLPIVQYDARAGRFFRSDRGVDNMGNWDTVKEDITAEFKALCDFENIEVGWINFAPGAPPSFVLVPMGQRLPDRPSDQHKNGVRFLVKLAKNIGGDKPIREIASTAKAFLSGIETAFLEYQSQKASNPGKLPVLALVKTQPITTGSGQRQSTNYAPVFKIIGWAPRGDLVPQLRSGANTTQSVVQQQMPWDGGNTGNATAPSTGGTRATPPAQAAAQAAAQQTVTPDDFG